MSSAEQNCGYLKIDIVNADGTLIDGQLFRDQRLAYTRSFVICQQRILSSVGMHNFRIRAYFTIAPHNYADSAEFSVKIVDPCDSPSLVTYPVLADQEYTITDSGYEYHLQPKFHVKPELCPALLVVNTAP